MLSLGTLLLLCALICELLAAFNVSQPPWLNWLGLGLAFLIASMLFGGIVLR